MGIASVSSIIDKYFLQDIKGLMTVITRTVNLQNMFSNM